MRPEGQKQHLGDVKQKKEDSCNTSSLDIFSPAHTGIYKPAFALSLLPSPAICTSGLLQTGQGTPHSRVCLSREEIQLQSLQHGLLWLAGGCSSVSCGAPVLLGQLLVHLTSWGGLWPCFPCQGQAELTAPHPGCQHHSSSSAGIITAADTAAGSLCEESLAHLETAATSLLGLLKPTLHQSVYSVGYLPFSIIYLAFP